MITVDVYKRTQIKAGEPIATLSYSGEDDTVIIQTDDIGVEQELTVFLQTVLSLTKQGRADPEDRQLWMESLPKVKISVPYWFKIVDPTDENIEEVDDDNEEAYDEEGDEDGGDDGDESDSGDGSNPDGGSSIGGFISHNG